MFSICLVVLFYLFFICFISDLHINFGYSTIKPNLPPPPSPLGLILGLTHLLMIFHLIVISICCMKNLMQYMNERCKLQRLNDNKIKNLNLLGLMEMLNTIEGMTKQKNILIYLLNSLKIMAFVHNTQCQVCHSKTVQLKGIIAL